MQILIQNISMFSDRQLVQDTSIAIEDGYITAIGDDANKAFEHPHWRLQGNNRIALPGLINLHTHSAMTLCRGIADDKPLMTWLKDYIWPLEENLTARDIYWGNMLAIAEMLQWGTTTFSDMYFEMEQAAKAVEETGIRGVLGQGLIDGQDREERLARAMAFVSEWEGAANGRITTMLAPHAPYTCSIPFMKTIVKEAEHKDLPIHIHLAETKDEVETIQKDYGTTPIQWAENAGVFTRPTLAAHCVHLTEDDMHILKERNVGVAYNPQSNMKLASGIAPVHQLLDLGVAVGFGTDGVGSNNSLDMFKEMKTGALLQKVVSSRADVLSAPQVLNMATALAAKALQLHGEIGAIKEGFKGDITIVNLDQPHLTPCYNPLSHLLYSCQGSDVETVLVDGRPLYHKGNFLTMDIERIRYEVQAIAKRLQKG